MVLVSQDEIESIAIGETSPGCSLVVEALKYLLLFFLPSVEEFLTPAFPARWNIDWRHSFWFTICSDRDLKQICKTQRWNYFKSHNKNKYDNFCCFHVFGLFLLSVLAVSVHRVFCNCIKKAFKKKQTANYWPVCHSDLLFLSVFHSLYCFCFSVSPKLVRSRLLSFFLLKWFKTPLYVIETSAN